MEPKTSAQQSGTPESQHIHDNVERAQESNEKRPLSNVRQGPIPSTRPLQKQQPQIDTRPASPYQHPRSHKSQQQLPSPGTSSETFRRKRDFDSAIKSPQVEQQALSEPPQKRARIEAPPSSFNTAAERVQYWVHESHWPKQDFSPLPGMGDLPATKRPRSDSVDSPYDDHVTTASDQKSRTLKSSPYFDPRYQTLLALKHSFMTDSDQKIAPDELKLCEALRSTKQDPPVGTLFDDKYFLRTYDRIQSQNETRVIRDIALLITPSAETLATLGATTLDGLAETTNAAWNKSIPVQGPRPQPDYSVGFHVSVFSEDQLHRLNGGTHTYLNIKVVEQTNYAATDAMYFPFLTSEIKCGEQALDIADRQNAHSMTIAVRAVVELYRTVKREHEVHRKVLAFSLSHDNHIVRIYAHYPEIQGPETKYYRYFVGEISIRFDRWAAYQFVRNVYDSFMPMHLERIKSAVGDLPDYTLKSPAVALTLVEAGPETEDGQSSVLVATPSTPSLDDNGGFKKPAIPARETPLAKQWRATAESLEKKNELLQKQLQQLLEQQERQRQESRQDMERQRQEFIQQMEAQRQEASSKMDQLFELLKGGASTKD